jgi:pimeloyl-ACP methyl ester carboxylesterase
MVKPALASSAVKAEPTGPIRIEALAGAEPPVFVLRGEPRGAGRLVFLHGMCGHGLGYAQSFQFSAAARGTLIAPQADVSCGGVWSKWSADLNKLDARIVETFKSLGHSEPIDDIVIIGMSQGATRAAELAKKWPERYTRLISMDAPTALRPGELRSLKAAVMMAGERDRQDLMRQSERALQRSGVPVTFVLIPQATHGAMGPTPEATMDKAFAFLDAPTAASAPKPEPVE